MKKLALASMALFTVTAAFANLDKQAIPGTWLLNGKDKNIRFVFKKDGTFNFAATNATSRGKWAVNGGSLKLVWTEIDKQKVSPGKVKASYKFNEDGSFNIDKFNYRKFN
jgi:hypothetical protein